MKVLILATDIFTRGGIARYTYTLASSLGSALGPENVDVLSFWDWGSSDQRPSEFRVIEMISSRGRAGLLSRLRFLFKAATAGIKGYDLVIANHVALAPVAALMKLIFETPYWVACHSVEIWWGTSRLRRAALKNANLILPVSRYTADAVQKMDGFPTSRVKVIYNAIPNSFARSLLAEDFPATSVTAPEEKRPLLLTVCTLVKGNEFKGVDTVLKALPQILKTLPGLQYVVVGEGEIKAKLSTFAAQLGIAENVSFVGEVTDSELADFYRLCDAFVLPSRGQELRGEIGGEGFGRVYVEAALAGKPVIGSRCGGASEAVLDGKTGLLVNPASTEEVAEAVLAILCNPRLAAEMGFAGRTWALDTFSEDALSRSLKELLRPYGVDAERIPKLVHADEQS